MRNSASPPSASRRGKAGNRLLLRPAMLQLDYVVISQQKAVLHVARNLALFNGTALPLLMACVYVRQRTDVRPARA